MRIVFGVVCSLGLLAGCGGSMQGNLGNAACEASCDEAKTTCVDECAEEVDIDACRFACEEARQKCESECKN